MKWSEKNGIINVNFNKLINLLNLNNCWNMKNRNLYARKMHAGSVITIFLYLYSHKANLLLFTNLFLDFQISETRTHNFFVIQVYHLMLYSISKWIILKEKVDDAHKICCLRQYFNYIICCLWKINMFYQYILSIVFILTTMTVICSEVWF